MSDDNKYSAVEELLGLPPGSTPKMSTDLMLRASVKKGAEVIKEAVTVNEMSKLNPVALSKTGTTLEQLKSIRQKIVEEAIATLEATKVLRDRFMTELVDNTNPSDKMFSAGSSVMVSSMNTIDKLNTVIHKIQQEILIEKEIEERNSESAAETGSFVSTTDMMSMVSQARDEMNRSNAEFREARKLEHKK